VQGLATFRHPDTEANRDGLVIGYATLAYVLVNTVQGQEGSWEAGVFAPAEVRVSYRHLFTGQLR